MNCFTSREIESERGGREREREREALLINYYRCGTEDEEPCVNVCIYYVHVHILYCTVLYCTYACTCTVYVNVLYLDTKQCLTSQGSNGR